MPPLAIKLALLNSEFWKTPFFRIRIMPTWGTYLLGSARFGEAEGSGLGNPFALNI
jgi:hypothetical protein